MKVGIFDDEQDMRTLISDFLEDEGHEIITTANSPEKLQNIDKCDILIIDVKAPNDRYAGINYVIKQRSESKINPSTIVIFISNFGRDNKEIKLLLDKVGRYEWLDKPIEISELKRIITNIII